MWQKQVVFRLIWCATASLTLLGCQSDERPWGAVSGSVLRDGQPIEPVIVLFSNRELGVEITAETNAAGHFTMRTDRIAGLPVGNYRVAITPKPLNLPPPEQGMMFNGPAPAATSAIAEQYRDVATTPLQAKVVAGANDFDFDLPASL
jgi:hypothetical protein